MPCAADAGAVVHVGRKVLLDERLPGAQGPAFPQPGVERLQPLRGLADEQHERHVAELRHDVEPDL
jgi:hypothetical protein